jgi:hypothetical protein
VYSVTVTSGSISTTTTIGNLAISSNAWIANLSARAYVSAGSPLIAGFVTAGSANKSVLVRGDGPSLLNFQIYNFLADPQLTLASASGTNLATTQSWSTALAPTFSQVGAFNLIPGSHDTALAESLAPGSYTAQVATQTTKSGVVLAEIYDSDSGAPANRLVNISARALVGPGNNQLIGGFVVGGTTPETVIIRGDGPSLAAFGVAGALGNTVLSLSNSTGTIATNSGWSNSPGVGGAATGGILIQPLTAALSARVGAFALAGGSFDSAMVATLPPGNYTVQIASGNGVTGIALLEIYELR